MSRYGFLGGANMVLICFKTGDPLDYFIPSYPLALASFLNLLELTFANFKDVTISQPYPPSGASCCANLLFGTLQLLTSPTLLRSRTSF